MLNNSTTDQTLRVTLYQADFNARKVPVDPPGPLTLTLEPGITSGRAYSVGVSAELKVGRYYELVVEMDDPRLLPSVQVWDTEGATVIPFSATTRQSGLDADGSKWRKGAVDAVLKDAGLDASQAPAEFAAAVDRIARSGVGQGRLAACEQAAHEIHHRRGRRAASCGCASGARR